MRWSGWARSREGAVLRCIPPADARPDARPDRHRSQLLALAEETAGGCPTGRWWSAHAGLQRREAGDRSDASAAARRRGDRRARGDPRAVAEIAWIYLGLGLPEDARRLATTFDQRVLARLPRDHNYLLILHLLLDVALATGLDDLVETITPLLLPYAGRAVINAGAVMFHGVTDDTLARACQRLGDAEPAVALREKALATYSRIGATWWRERLAADAARPASPAVDRDDAATRTGRACGSSAGRRSSLPARRGLEHLHALLAPRDRGARHPTGRGSETVEQAGLGTWSMPRRSRRTAVGSPRSTPSSTEADAWGDAARGAQADGRARRVPVGGVRRHRARRPPPPDRQRCRAGQGSVRKAIATALDAIHGADPVVARHLTTHVHTGERLPLRARCRPPGDLAAVTACPDGGRREGENPWSNPQPHHAPPAGPGYDDLRALFINCTLKRSPELTHTGGLIDVSRAHHGEAGRARRRDPRVDHDIATGVWPDMTEHGWATDEWPALYEQVMAADILVIAGPIWLGDNSSVTKQVIERLYACSQPAQRRRASTPTTAGSAAA